MRYLVKLRFKRGVHIGSDMATPGSESIATMIHSDTIFSAIVNQWVRLTGKGDYGGNIPSIEELIEGFKNSTPPFLLSSAFLFKEEDYYLPTPIGTSPVFFKTLKDVSFLELDDFVELADGNCNKLQNRTFSNPEEQIVSFFTNPRVTLDRITNTSNIFSSSGISFKRGGLYFIVDFSSEAFAFPFFAALELLSYAGFGGDRSVGYGSFTFEKELIDAHPRWGLIFQKREGTVSYCSLSLCFPHEGEERNAFTYRLIPRKGWIYSSSTSVQLKRRECKMLSEGSLFSEPIKGQLVDVTPGEFKGFHPVYRYGFGMMVVMANRD